MEVGGVVGQRDISLLRRFDMAVLGAGGGDVGAAEQMPRLLDRLVAPDTGLDEVGTTAAAKQVHGHRGKLLGGTPLGEQHPIVVRNCEQFTQIGLGALGDGHVLAGAVAHLHHREPAALIVQHLALGTFEYCGR